MNRASFRFRSKKKNIQNNLRFLRKFRGRKKKTDSSNGGLIWFNGDLLWQKVQKIILNKQKFSYLMLIR